MWVPAVPSNRHHQQVVNTEGKWVCRSQGSKLSQWHPNSSKWGGGGVTVCVWICTGASQRKSLSHFNFSLALVIKPALCYELLVAMVTLCFLIIADLLKQRWESDSSDNILQSGLDNNSPLLCLLIFLWSLCRSRGDGSTGPCFKVFI